MGRKLVISAPGTKVLRGVLVMGALCLMPWRAAGAEYLGAEAVLARVLEGKTTATATVKPATEADRLKEEVKAFGARRREMPATDAAQGWVALYDRFWTLPEEQRTTYMYVYRGMGMMTGVTPLSIGEVFQALPEPAAWGEIEKIAMGRGVGEEPYANEALRMIALFLGGNREGVRKELADFETRLKVRDAEAHEEKAEAIGELRRHLEDLSATPTDLAARFERLLEAYAAAGGDEVIQIPDFVEQLGEARAADLIRKTLALPKARVTVPGKGATLKLTQRLALEMADQLQTPQWGLVVDMDSVALYEAMDRKFPRKKEQGPDAAASRQLQSNVFAGLVDRFSGSYDMGDTDSRINEGREEADAFFLMALVSQGRVDEATSKTLGLPKEAQQSLDFSEAWNTVDQVAAGPAFFDYLGNLVEQENLARQWSTYVQLAPEVGQTGTMQEKLRAMVGNEKDAEKKVILQDQLVMALLMNDQVDEALVELRTQFQAPAQAKSRIDYGLGGDEERRPRMLAALGVLLERPELVQEGLAALTEVEERREAGAHRIYYTGYRTAFVSELIRGDYGVDAENYLLRAMAETAEKIKGPSAAGGWEAMNASETNRKSMRDMLEALALVYNKAGRHADVLTLLEKAPWWGEADLVDLYENYYGMKSRKSIQAIAAEALHAAGRDAEAVRILKAHLQLERQEDAAYRLLATIEGLALIPWLDEMAQRDRFEERPLIWKAVLLNEAGRHAEAEAVAREAMRVDPTDGEQPVGDRIRSYSVLAEALEKQGKTDEAKTLKDIVTSVEIAGRGDRFAEAGLAKRSLQEYEKAMQAFADAYCIQWRMAEKLTAQGQREAAEEHYKRAFEVMPDQFGRVANLCFGCERVFDNQHSAPVAERVIVELVRTNPEKPQVHYLLGQLRGAQKRYEEANAAYRKALELDPEYVDALGQIFAISEEVFMKPEERDALLLRGLRLDPLRRHLQGDLEVVHDIGALWEAIAENRRFAATKPESMLALPASGEALEEMKKENPEMMQDDFGVFGESRWELPEPPEKVIARHDVIEGIIALAGE